MKIEMTHPSAPVSSEMYPALDPPIDQSFRLQKIGEIQKQLEDERDYRSCLYKKYQWAVNILDGINTAVLLTSLGSGAAGIGLLASLIAAPAALVLESVSAGCGVLSLASKYVSKKMVSKAQKHAEIRLLAATKLATVQEFVSKALNDGKIADEEFRLVLTEIEKYRVMKRELQDRSRGGYSSIQLDEMTKNELIQRGKDQARAALLRKLGE